MEKDDDEEAPNESDDALWRAILHETTPLPGSPRVAPPPDTKRHVLSGFRRRERDFIFTDVLPAGDGSLPGLDRRTDDRLRRGEMQIDGRVDLHGMTQDRALKALEAFIRRCHDEGRRCVLVITGRGAPRGNRQQEPDWYEPQPGILRQRVPEWLRTGALSGLILRVYPARPQHGGDGAFYVLLRRRRD